MLNHRHNLAFGHFVGRLQDEEMRRAPLFLKALLQLALGLPGAKDQDWSTIPKLRDDGGVVARKLPGIFPLTRIVGRNFLRFKRAMSRLT